MKVLVPTPDEILTYTKQRKIAWSKLQNEDFWWSSNTRFWAFTLDINVMTYFRITSDRGHFIVERKLNTLTEAKQLCDYLSNGLNSNNYS